MFARVEAFYRPGTVREALRLLQNTKGSARIVAGCADVIAGPVGRPGRPVRFLIDITHTGLSYIRLRAATWSIGATTTMAEIEQSAELYGLAGGLLARAAATCGSVQIRDIATVGGNMANGSPAADLAAPLLALDAMAVVATSERRRKMPLADYLATARSGTMVNSLLVELTFPDPPRGSRCGWSFQKFGRTAVDLSLVNVAAGLQLDARGRVKWARIALGAVTPVPARMAGGEALMAGRTLDRALLAEACESVGREVRPIGDIRASAEYRRELSRILTGRALEECAASAGCCL
jgi:CO/xanthine dehydrogenase FAD-binding subunit